MDCAQRSVLASNPELIQLTSLRPIETSGEKHVPETTPEQLQFMVFRMLLNSYQSSPGGFFMVGFLLAPRLIVRHVLVDMALLSQTQPLCKEAGMEFRVLDVK
jgi:hypothetical protein